MRKILMCGVTVGALGALLAGAAVAAPTTGLVSRGVDDQQPTGGSTITTGLACISGDGQVAGFYSEADNLVQAGTSGGDLFVTVRGGGQAERVNLAPGGEQADGPVDKGLDALLLTNTSCSLDRGGEKIVFASVAGNLVAGDTNDNVIDVFLRDLSSEENFKISATGNGNSRAPAISADGSYVAFLSEASNLDADCSDGRRHVFLADVSDPANPQINCLSVNPGGVEGDGESKSQPGISEDGLYVVFDSSSTNLVAGDTNATSDIFLFQRSAGGLDGTLQRVSVSVDGEQSDGPSDRPVISANGDVIAFVSAATNLVPDDTQPLNEFDLSPIDVFVYNRKDDRLESTRANVDSQERQANVINDSGISPGIDPAISETGRFIVFVSSSTNLVPGDDNNRRDVFLRDREQGITELISVARSGGAGNNRSFRPVVSGDGLFVVFDSIASDLVEADTNNGFDVFIRGPRELDDAIFSDDFDAGG